MQEPQPKLPSGAAQNIVLIGSTGAGKSSFANFLLSEYGSDHEAKFCVGNSGQPCTQDVQVEQREIHNVRNPSSRVLLNIVDTPGLNEPDPRTDLKHIADIASCIKERLNHVHCVVVVIPLDFRKDSQTVATFAYYRQLLKPVFDARSVILVFTGADRLFGALQERKQWDRVKEERRLVMCKLLECEVDICEALTSRPDREHIDALLQHLAQPLSGKSLAEHLAPEKSVAVHSYYARERLLDFMTLFRPVTMDNSFPLPPRIEELRARHVEKLEAMKSITVKTVETEDTGRGLRLRQRDLLDRQRLEQGDKRRAAENDIHTLSQQQVSHPFYLGGDTRVNVFNRGFALWADEPSTPDPAIERYAGVIPDRVLSDPSFEIVTQAWNCTAERDTTSAIPKYRIKPDFFTFRADPNISYPHEDLEKPPRWYIRMYASYDGERTNARQLAELRQTRDSAAIAETTLAAQLLNVEEENKAINKKLAAHQENLTKLDAELKDISRHLYSLEELVRLHKLANSWQKT